MEDKDKVEDETNLGDVYFLKIGRIRYLKSKNYKKNCCQVCGKKRKTTAHHLIPKRLRCICPFLAEIRVRVCSECDDMFHPENKFIKGSDIIKSQSKNISNLQDAVRWRDNKIRALIKGMGKIGVEVAGLIGLKDEDFYITKYKKEKKKESRAKPDVNLQGLKGGGRRC